MDSSFLFTSDQAVADRIIPMVQAFSDIQINTCLDLKSGLISLRDKPASIVFVSEEYPRELFNQLILALRQDPVLEYISLYLLVERWNEEMVQKWFAKPPIYGWIDLMADLPMKQFQLKNALQKTYSLKRLQKLTLDNQYIQNELSYYDRKRKYETEKANLQKQAELKELMHLVRSVLTFIKDGLHILVNEEVSDDEKDTTVNLMFRNIWKIETFMKAHDHQWGEAETKKNSPFTIIPIQSLITSLESKLMYEARKRNISLYIEPKESTHSVLLKTEDLEFMIMDLFQAALLLVKDGGVVYMTAYPLLSANTIEMKWLTDVDNIDHDAFTKLLQTHFQTIQWLDDKESKFERIWNADQAGFRFTLLRLT